MRPDHAHRHLHATELSRRDLLRAAAAAGGAGALGALGLRLGSAGAASRQSPGAALPAVAAGDFSDEMFDVAAVKAGAWDDTAFYAKGDQRGTFQEVTPERTAKALRVLEAGAPVVTYNLGELMYNGFPAFKTSPPRLYEQRLSVVGYQPRDGFAGVFGGATGLGSNELSIHEERFRVPQEVLDKGQPYTSTYQIATQLDNLNHIGLGDVFYGGHRGADIAESWGTNKLGGEHMGPIVTRGVVVDVLGLKLKAGATDVLSQASNGQPLLKEGYRITVEDIEAALARQRSHAIGAGDVVLFRTGWNQLVLPQASGHPDHGRYTAGEPGIFLREARYLADRRPAIVGGDGWALEVLPAPVEGVAFPVHQELLIHYGIRIGEAMVTDALVADGAYEFVYIITPQYALGATAGNTPPAALATPSAVARIARSLDPSE